jgi:hypothetical protein
MTNNGNLATKSFARTEAPKDSSLLGTAVTVEILQNNFTSDTERNEFTQAVKMHGVTFLYLANSPLPEPSSRDLNTIERLARVLSRFWPQALVIGGCHE